MRKSENAALAIGVILCLLIGAHRSYRFYYESFPVANEGECLQLDFLGDRTKVQVIKNMTETSVVQTEEGIVADFSFEELRDANASKVNCE